MNGARVTFVNSSVEDPPAPPPRRSKHHQHNHGSSAKSAKYSEIRSCAAPSGTKEAIYHPLAQLGASNACQFDKPGAQVIHVVRPNPLAKHPSEYTEAERNAAALRTISNPEEVNAFLKRWAEDRGWTFATAEIDETWSVDDQASFFCDARVVFGIHGAGLMNIFWSNAGRNQGFAAAAAAAKEKAEHKKVDEREKSSAGKDGGGFEASVGKIAVEAGDDDRAVSAPTRWIVDVAPGDATWFDDAAEAAGIVHVRSTTGHETHDESARLGEGDDGVDRLMGWTEVFVAGLEEDFRAAGVGEMAAAKEVPEREKEERARRAKRALKKRTQAHGFVV